MIVFHNSMLRNILRYGVPLVIIPALAVGSAVAFEQRRSIVISLIAAVLAFLAFCADFEKKTKGSRRIVIVAVMTALCFAGRFIPILMPIQALTILTALYIGSESGFLVGALTAVLSNFYFGQGPWTVFQMLAWGMIGYIAGKLSVPLCRSRSLLILYGILAGICYSFVMDVWTVLWAAGRFDLSVYLAALVTAIPYTVSYALSNVLYLWLLAKPVGEKLSRIRIKYGV